MQERHLESCVQAGFDRKRFTEDEAPLTDDDRVYLVTAQLEGRLRPGKSTKWAVLIRPYAETDIALLRNEPDWYVATTDRSALAALKRGHYYP